jgi:hypothetical protein
MAMADDCGQRLVRRGDWRAPTTVERAKFLPEVRACAWFMSGGSGWDGVTVTEFGPQATLGGLAEDKEDPALPVRKAKCPTCPFHPKSKLAYLAPDLTQSALTTGSRICHSTGANNAIHKKTGKPEELCRGARDQQLQMFHRLGFIEEPTDEAWAKKWASVRKQQCQESEKVASLLT